MQFSKHKKIDIPKEEINTSKLTKNARSMQRRISTPLVLKYRWHQLCFMLLGFAFFIFMHKLILFIMIKTKKYTWIDYITCLRRGNNYDLLNMRSVYYINPETIEFLFLPACVALGLGMIMYIIKIIYYKEYVKHEIRKSSK